MLPRIWNVCNGNAGGGATYGKSTKGVGRRETGMVGRLLPVCLILAALALMFTGCGKKSYDASGGSATTVNLKIEGDIHVMSVNDQVLPYMDSKGEFVKHTTVTLDPTVANNVVVHFAINHKSIADWIRGAVSAVLDELIGISAETSSTLKGYQEVRIEPMSEYVGGTTAVKSASLSMEIDSKSHTVKSILKVNKNTVTLGEQAYTDSGENVWGKWFVNILCMAAVLAVIVGIIYLTNFLFEISGSVIVAALPIAIIVIAFAVFIFMNMRNNGSESKSMPETAVATTVATTAAPTTAAMAPAPTTAAPVETTPAYEMWTVTAQSLNVRSSKSSSGSGNVVGSVRKGDEVKVLGIDGDWAKIEFDGEEAYVSAKYLER
ncbi:MAG: SH3 domain-containing protein [Lachnospiraceae bacterium]|jgi:hypothetical protein|nr:SH3 domain-containing protein [Lachnospiraceae bacterium]